VPGPGALDKKQLKTKKFTSEFRENSSVSA